jgi:hypothetical protein
MSQGVDYTGSSVQPRCGEWYIPRQLRILFWNMVSGTSWLISFLFFLYESRGEIFFKGVVLSHPKISNFGM